MGGGGEVGGESDVSVGGGDGGGGVGGGGEGGGECSGGLDEPLAMESISIMTNIMTNIAQLCLWNQELLLSIIFARLRLRATTADFQLQDAAWVLRGNKKQREQRCLTSS